MKPLEKQQDIEIWKHLQCIYSKLKRDIEANPVPCRDKLYAEMNVLLKTMIEFRIINR